MNRGQQLVWLVCSDSVPASISKLDLHRIEARYVEQPAASDLPEAPAIVPAVPDGGGGMDVSNHESFSDEANAEQQSDFITRYADRQRMKQKKNDEKNHCECAEGRSLIRGVARGDLRNCYPGKEKNERGQQNADQCSRL